MGFDGKGFSMEAMKVIRAYEEHGWVFARSKSGHAIGKAPDGAETVSIARDLSPANRSQQNAEAGLKRWLRAQERVADRSLAVLAKPVLEAIEDSFHPNRVAVVAGAVALGWEPELIPNGAVRLVRSGARPVVVRKSDRPLTKREWHDLNARIQKGGDPMTVALAARMSQEEWVEYVVREFADHDITLKVAVAAPVEAAEVVEPDPKVGIEVERRPWKATSGTGKYESKAVVEVMAGDEVVGYECSRCGWEADDPHSVAAHYRAGHRRGAGREPVNPVTEKNLDYKPSARLVEALAEWLDGESWDNLDDLAVLMLRWAKIRPDLPEPEPREPLTDAQIIERIRHLVGTGVAQGAYDEALATIEAQVVAMERLRGEIAALARQVEAVTADRDRIQGDLDAWLALAPRRGEA